MYKDFRWTLASLKRNELLAKYEPIQPYVLWAFAREFGAKIFLDVGANIGAYSLFMSSLPDLERIYAFEPAPQTFSELTENIRLNGLQGRVAAINRAVSDAGGAVNFGIVSEYSGANSIVNTTIHDKTSFKNEILIDCVRLDDQVPEGQSPVCIKIDVEGHEAGVMRGAGRLLRERPVVMQVEDYGRDRSVFDGLREAGFSQILALGPDVYLTNAPDKFPEGRIVSSLEDAAKALIANNLKVAPPLPQHDRPVRARLPGVTIEVNGRMAQWVRGAKHWLGSTRPNPLP